jgi:hypothetical protein
VDGDFDSRQAAKDVCGFFETAESCIKELELLYNEGLAFPSVNQLRYAGFHIASALKETDLAEQEEQWKRATRHCQRAIYDASEMALVYCLEEYKSFKIDYKTVDVSPSVPDYLDIVKKIRETQELIKSTDCATREDKYDDCQRYFKEVKPLIDRLNDARSELNKRLKIQRRKVWFAIFTILITLAGMIASLHW